MAKNNKSNKNNREERNEFKRSDRNQKSGRKDEYFKKVGKDIADSKHLTNSCNDPDWYFADPVIARDVASVPFNKMSGVPFSVGTPLAGNNTFTGKLQATPGMMIFRMNPSIGYSIDPSSPINVGANSLYTWTRYMNSGATNYSATDEMIFCIAMANIISCINYYMRAYGLACTYAYENRYIPDAVMEQIGPMSPSVMRNNMANYRAMVNMFINKTASFAVPATIKYFRRSAFLYSNYYIEGSSIKDQMYAYAPNAFYKFSRTQDGLPQLTLSTPPIGKSLTEASDYLNSLISPLISDEAFNTISGDIKKAFGEENLIKLVELPEKYVLAPVFELGVLEQMKNADIVTPNTSSTTITEVIEDLGGDTTSYLKCELTLNSQFMGAAASGGETALQTQLQNILTTTTQFTGPELVMESTRCKVAVESASATAPMYTGADYPVAIQVLRPDIDQATGAITYVVDDLMSYNGAILWNDADIAISSAVHVPLQLIKFRFAPIYYIWEQSGTNAFKLESVVANLDNIAVLDNHTLKSIHEAAMLSLFNVPVIGKIGLYEQKRINK